MKDKVLKLCRRLKKCTLNDLVSLTEEKEDIVSTALLYLENKGCIEIKDDNIIYIDNPIPKGRADKKDINLMSQFRTPEEMDIIIKGFCLEIPPQKLCELINLHANCICHYYTIFRKMIYERQYNKLLDKFFDKPQEGRYQTFYEKYAFFYIYNHQVYVSEKLLRASLEKKFEKSQIREYKAMYSYLRRVESHNVNEFYMFYRLAEYIWRRCREYAYLYQDLKQNLLNIA